MHGSARRATPAPLEAHTAKEVHDEISAAEQHACALRRGAAEQRSGETVRPSSAPSARGAAEQRTIGAAHADLRNGTADVSKSIRRIVPATEVSLSIIHIS